VSSLAVLLVEIERSTKCCEFLGCFNKARFDGGSSQQAINKTKWLTHNIRKRSEQRTKASHSSQQIIPLNAHNRKTVFQHQMMWAEWIVGDGAHYNEWFPVSQPQEDRSTMAVEDGVDGYCSPRNNQQGRMKV
jgi:hypothetical protein